MRQLTRILVFLTLSQHLVNAHPVQSWGSYEFKSLVSFGNSYTDESRLNYFTEHKDAPPAGWKEPDVYLLLPIRLPY